MNKSRRTYVFALSAIAAVLSAGGWALFSGDSFGQARGRGHTLESIPFDGARAYLALQELCAMGPRISGSEGMIQQRALLTRHFTELGGQVSEQAWEVRHPQTGAATRLVNLMVQWHPDRKQRILICTHYDTRPYPDEDPDPARRRDVFLGANDGTSGVALMMELGRHLPELKSRYGVDFVFFDAEEFIYEKNRDPFFIGSKHFANQYATQPPPYKYVCGVLLDMVGDRDLQLFYERNSMYDRQTRPIAVGIWNQARQLKVTEFVSRTKHEVNDDHIALIQIARIPTCDVIDFDYRRPDGQSLWHTTQDVPENCSALSLAKVGWVISEWIKNYP